MLVRERILYVTSQFPYGRNEAFLGAEVRALAALSDVLVVAVRPQAAHPIAGFTLAGTALRMRSARTLAQAFRMVISRPRACAVIAARMCSAPYRPAAKLKNIAVFVKGLALAEYARTHGATLIHAHWLTTPSTVAFIAARLANLPLSISAHRFDLFADNWIADKMAGANAVRVISQRGAADLRARTPAAVWDRIHVVHLGVELPPKKHSRGLTSGPLRVAAIGSLVEVKGQCDLIAAAARLRDGGAAIRCTIVGEGPLHAALQAQIEASGLAGSVALRGFVPHEQLIAELRAGAFDVIAHPSIEDGTLHEGIPVALMEAMALGIPCVATSTGSIPELIDATCGMLVGQRDPAALADALARLATDPELRASLGAAARERVTVSFDAERNARTLFDLMRSAG
jgi:colanic acid/amylovoran biosynthesis glycosyltransferase